jgi:hypothetical protein
MIVEFLSEAKSELMDAINYYEGESSGLGHRFFDSKGGDNLRYGLASFRWFETRSFMFGEADDDGT